jgi:hypothetical protein
MVSEQISATSHLWYFLCLLASSTGRSERSEEVALRTTSATFATLATPAPIPTTPMERKYVLEKLTENNYRMWKVKVELILTRMNLIGIVKGADKRPFTEPARTQWKINDLDAKTEIIIQLSDGQLDLVKHLESSNEIWDALKDHHESSDNFCPFE